MIEGYKGFDRDWTCLNQRYRLGETVTVDGKLEMCENGIHFCKNPIGVFGYYSPCDSVYARIEASDECIQEPASSFNTTKCCARSITVKSELDVWDMVFFAEDYMSANSINGNKNIYTENYYEERVNVTYVRDPYSYWVATSTMVLATELSSCVRNTGGGIAIAMAPLSIATVERGWEGVAIANGSQSAARAASSGAVAVTLGCDSVAITEGDESVAFVGASSLAVVKGRNSVGMSVFRGAKVLLEGDGCVAMALGDVEVRGKGCVVILACGYKKEALIKATAGTRLLIPFLDTMTYNEIICGEADDWPAGVARSYMDIMEDFLKNV